MRMRIRNFKGIESLDINFDGKDTVISGQNRLGKTSVADAFFWCLYGKNKDNSSDSGTSGFSVRRIDSDGNPVTDEVSVQVILSVDGKEKDFMRHNTATFDNGRLVSSETLYFISGCLVKKKDFEAAIDSIISGELFRIMSDPFYFQQLKWERQRELLTSIVPDIEVPEKYAKIAAKVDEVGAESYKKSLNSTIKENETRISQLHGQIEGIRMSMPQKGEWENLDEQEQTCRDMLENLVGQLDSIKDDDRERAVKLEQELNEMLLKEKNHIQNENYINESSRNDITGRIKENESALAKSERFIDVSKADKLSLMAQIEYHQNEKNKLYEEWDAVSKSAPEEGVVCPITNGTCSSEAAIALYRKNFRQNIESRLTEIRSKGVAINDKVNILKSSIATLDENIKAHTADADSYRENIAALKTALEKLPTEVPVVDTKKIAGYTEKEAELLSLKSKMETSDNGNDEKRRLLKEHIASVNLEIAKISTAREGIYKRKESEEKIAEIEGKIATCQDTISEYQKGLEDLKEYQSALSTATEEGVNRLFNNVKVRMFETQLNGNIADTCRLIDENGVKWSDWSTSEKTVNGLDIINAFANHYNVTIPVFIDNAEGISSNITHKQQVIMLVVTEEENLTVTNL